MESPMEHSLLIDTDPGVDDALALLMALAHPGTRVVALTIAAGNVGLAHTVANALKLLEVAGAEVPVHPGCPQPLLHAAADAAFVHGRDGFGDTGYQPATRRPEAEHAALAMLRLSRERPGELTFVMLGPLTNLALALTLDPTLPQRVRRLVVMGGAASGRGNTTVPAEFNIGFDPEAAHIVFEGWPCLELVDWEAVLRHPLRAATFAGWLRTDSLHARFYDAISRRTRDWSEERRGDDWLCADALAMAQVLEPEGALQAEDRAVAVELGGRLTRGATVVDWDARSGRPANARIVIRYEQARFERLVRAALGPPPALAMG
jgi:purine nucleosidase